MTTNNILQLQNKPRRDDTFLTVQRGKMVHKLKYSGLD